MPTTFPQYADGVEATVSGTIAPNPGTITVTVTQGTWPTPGNVFYATVFNSTLYATPDADPTHETYEVTAVSGSTWTVTGGQRGTTAANHVGTPTLWLIWQKGDADGITTAINDLETLVEGASFVTVDAETGLPASRKLVAGTGISLTDGGAGGNITISSSGGVSSGTGAPSTNDFRLTLQTGVPVPENIGSSSNTLYLTPYKGQSIGLYNGTHWVILTTAEISISISALTEGDVYDIFAYSDSGVVALDTPVVWSDANDRATDLVRQDGVWVSGSDATRRYVGSIYMDGSGTASDYNYTRSVFNADNRVSRGVTAGGGLVTTTNSDSWTQICFGPLFLIGLVNESVTFTGQAKCEGDSGNSTAAEIQIDGMGSAITQHVPGCYDTQALVCSTVGQPQLGVNNPSLDLRASVNGFTVQSIDDDATTGTIWFTGEIVQ